MISEARLRVIARERGIRLDVVEKDYVNSWILHAIFTSGLQNALVFKGGTALSKLYFPRVWRFSEDLDFTATGTISENVLAEALGDTSSTSGIGFSIKSFFANPGYIQIKVQYEAILGQKNTTSLDVSLQEPILTPVQSLIYQYEDIPTSSIKAYSIEEILVEKLRSLFQRARARDYYDLFFLLEKQKFDDRKILDLLSAKCRAKGITLDLSRFPDKGRVEEIRNYWDKGLERLTSSRPSFDQVLSKITEYMRHLAETGA